jgi:hypothetical protein
MPKPARGQKNNAKATNSGCVAFASFLAGILILLAIAGMIVYILKEQSIDLASILAFIRELSLSGPAAVGESLNLFFGFLAFVVASTSATVDLGLSLLYWIAVKLGASSKGKDLDVPRPGSPLQLFVPTLIYLFLSITVVLYFYT